ncbi:uncharacterized protein [Clytia hemisphaerica]|uniref:SUEL-type lectin domain-containing protein n=1 Tax=Clytia hemisphaerica TaxID=252671 RepID=A0A7M5XDV8_9CNID
MEVKSILKFVLLVVVCVEHAYCVKTFHDEELHSKIPLRLKREIEELVHKQLHQTISLHYNTNDDVISLSRDPIIKTNFHHRARRDLGDGIAGNETVYSEWSHFGFCSAKCGGGIRVRSRECLNGTCLNEDLIEKQSCGNFPCVSGSYVLEGISADWILRDLTDAITIKFFVLLNKIFLGKLTSTEIKLYNYELTSSTFKFAQSIQVQDGISFTIMETEQSIYLVVLEKFSGHYFGVSSRMYMYDPSRLSGGVFHTYQPIYFKVYDPSAVTSLEIYGKPYLAVVNRKNKARPGNERRTIVCNNEQQEIRCTGGTYISISEALYGRHNTWECPTINYARPYQFFYWCNIRVKDKISEICEDKDTCVVESRVLTLLGTSTDPCPYTNKYLKIVYSCSSLSYRSTPYFYEWNHVGLTIVPSDNLITYGAEDVESFHIHGNAFVAVANHINDQRQYHLDSEIYVFDLAKRQFRSFQKLRTDGAIDLEFFVIGRGITREYFLAVANHVKVVPGLGKTHEVDSIIYKWNWNLFVPFQCIKTNGAKKWTAVTGQNGEFILTHTNMHGNVTFYSYDGWRFYLTKKQPQDQIFQHSATTTSISINTPSFSTKMLAIQPKPEFVDDVNNIYSFQFKQVFPNFDLLETCLQTVQQINRTVYNELLPRAKQVNESFTKIKNDIVLLEDVIYLTENKTFTDLTVNGKTNLNNATIKNIKLSQSDLNTVTMVNNLQVQKTNQRNILAVLQNRIKSSVTYSTEQTITGLNKFQNDVYFKTLTINGNVSVGNLTNGKDLSNVSRDAIYINKDEVFESQITFTSNITFDSISVQHINNISTTKLRSINKASNISGQQTFQDFQTSSATQNNIQVNGLVDGVDTSKLVLLDTDQNITALHQFTNKTTMQQDFHIQGLVNNMDISTIASDTLKKNKEDTVTAYQRFSSIEIKGDLNMADKKTINDVDVSNLTSSGIYLNAVQEFGNIVFQNNVTFNDQISLGETLNNVTIDDLVFTDQTTVFHHPITFKQNITCSDHVTVDGKINNLNITEDIMDVSSNQTITGNTIFTKNLQMSNNLQVHDHLDGIDINAFIKNVMTYNTTQNVTATKFFSNLTTDSIWFNNCTDQQCTWLNILLKLKEESIHKTNGQISVNGTKSFSDVLIRGNLTLNGLLDGLEFPGDFLQRSIDEVINGTYTFNNVTFVKNITADTLNGYNLTELYERVLRKVGHEQIVIANWSFNDHTHFDELQVDGLVDGVNLSRDALLANQDHVISGEKTFQTVPTLNVYWCIT